MAMFAPGRERIAVLALALLAPALFWGCLEAAAWLAGVRSLSEDETYIARAKQRNCQFGWRDAERACAAGVFAHAEPELLVALGGSSVFGYPSGRPSFAARLAQRLEYAEPRRWRAVNRGRPCKDSFFVEQCAERALDAGAEVLVIYSGHNDFASYGVWNPSREIWLERHAWLFDLEVGLAQSRAFSLLMRLLRRDASPQWFPIQPDPARVRAAQEIVREQFTRHIESVIEKAKVRGTRIILSTVVSNLYEYPVARAEWDDNPLYDSEARPDLVPWSEHYRSGIAHHRAGRFAEALAEFSAARDVFMHGRAPSMLNDRIRELAQLHPEVELVDVERLVHAHASEGIGCNFFGDETYCDQFHPNERTHELIAAAFFAKLREMGLVRQMRRRRG